ncbi:MAG: transcriptional repressor LexA [Candidatus Dojkabacteria bacterium]
MLQPLTPKQKKILEYIELYWDLNEMSPSLEEIRQHFGLRAVSTVHEHIDRLKEKGYIKKEMNQARGILVTSTQYGQQSNEEAEINILGRITAGKPIEAIELPEPFRVGVDLLPSREDKYYALRVVGESMKDDGIFDGDLVVIRYQNSAENGEVVVAVIEDNYATLKKIFKERDGFRLQPANDRFQPQFHKKVEVRGKVVAVIRQFC